jgi:deoxyguanosine kinase
VGAALVSIIGPPAVGKTTAAEWLAEALPAVLVREDYAGNPFLSDSYLGRIEFRLPAQLYFLFSRVSQLDRRRWPAQALVVSDYGYCQDAVYAERNLAAEDLAVYRRLAGAADDAVKRPDVLIHLDGEEGTLLRRIALRGRQYERTFSAEFLGSMREAYRRLVERADCPVLAVDIDREDLLDSAARAALLGRVREALT